jgi:manganese/zinc/iron transport system substrate-binding protein
MRLLLFICLALVACNGCAPSASPSTSAKSKAGSRDYSGPYPIKAVATVGMVADLVRAVGGERVDVHQLLGSGVDPHLYKPTRDAVQALSNADIVFYNGLMLEGKMAESLRSINETKRSVAVAERLEPNRLGPQAEQGHPDPHVWMDVSLWSEAASIVCEELCEYDPNNANFYRERTQTARTRLDALHQYGVKQIGGIPSEQRVLVTSHDAFRYFGRAYGIEVEAIQGISTESEAGLQRVNDLVDLIVNRKVQAVFVESSVPKESIEALLRGAASRHHQVKIAAELFSDAMGEQGSYEGTYVGMMDHNLTSIARALGAPNVPETGFDQPADRIKK